jgi:hypothetical protein
MADIRFLISGNSAPFVAKLYQGTTLSCIKSIDYSGTCCNSCNVFPNLYSNTSYIICVTDGIGSTTSCSITTPAAVGPTTLVTKNICLAGTAGSTAPYSCFITDNLVISPVLSAGECAILCFTGYTKGNVGFRVNSNLNVSCRPSSISPWVTYDYNNINSNFAIPAITMYCGGELCYNLTTICNEGSVGDLCGCSILCLKSATPYGFNASYLGAQSKAIGISYVVPTTTVPPSTLTPITVYLGGFTNNSSNSTCAFLSAKVYTAPALVVGQSFKLCFTTQTQSCANTIYPDGGIAKPIYACSFLTCYGVCCNFSTSELPALTQGDIVNGNYNSILVNSANINDIILCVDIRSHIENELYDYINCGRLYFNTISESVGANFILTPDQCMSASSPTCLYPAYAGGTLIS